MSVLSSATFPSVHQRTRSPVPGFADPRWSLLTLSDECTSLPVRKSYGLLAVAAPLELSHSGRDVTLDDGDLAVVDLASSPGIRSSSNDRTRLLVFGDRALDRQISGIRASLGQRLSRDDPVGVTAGNLLDQLSRLISMGHADLGDGLVATIIALVTMLVSRTASPGKTLHGAAMLQRAQGVIAARFGDPRLRVTTVAEQLRISARHLSALFEPSGQTPAEYIAGVRIRHAQSLLADPHQVRRQILDIAMACGFDDQSHFSRCFKAHSGTTPRKFRHAKLG